MPFTPDGNVVPALQKMSSQGSSRGLSRHEKKGETPKTSRKKRLEERLAKASPQQLERARKRFEERSRALEAGIASTQESISATPDDLNRSLKKRKRNDKSRNRNTVHAPDRPSAAGSQFEMHARLPKMSSNRAANPTSPKQSKKSPEITKVKAPIAQRYATSDDHEPPDPPDLQSIITLWMKFETLDADQVADFVHGTYTKPLRAEPPFSRADLDLMQQDIPPCTAELDVRTTLRKICRKFMKSEELSKEDFTEYLKSPHQEDLELFWAAVKSNDDLDDAFENEIHASLQEMYTPEWLVKAIPNGKEQHVDNLEPQIEVQKKGVSPAKDDKLITPTERQSATGNVHGEFASSQYEESMDSTPSKRHSKRARKSLVSSQRNGSNLNVTPQATFSDYCASNDEDDDNKEGDKAEDKADNDKKDREVEIEKDDRQNEQEDDQDLEETANQVEGTTPQPIAQSEEHQGHVADEEIEEPGDTDMASESGAASTLDSDSEVSQDNDSPNSVQANAAKTSFLSVNASQTANPAQRSSETEDIELVPSTPLPKRKRKSQETKPNLIKTDIDYRTGPLSEHEKTIVREAIDSLMETKGLDYDTFCHAVHENTRKDRRAFWSSLINCIPDRNPKNMREYIKKAYKSTEFKTTSFTEKEKSRLNELVGKHGPQWSKIGLKMGRYREDCQQVYRRMMEAREHSAQGGAWTPTEQRKFDAAIASFTGSGKVDYNQIAEEMGTRTPRQCRDHARIRQRTDGTYSQSSTPSRPSIGKKAPRTPKSIIRVPKATYQTLTHDHLVKFVDYLLTLNLESLDEFDLPSDLGEFDVFGYDQLKRQVTTYRKKIKQWRTMQVDETLRQIKSYLQTHVPRVEASQEM